MERIEVGELLLLEGVWLDLLVFYEIEYRKLH